MGLIVWGGVEYEYPLTPQARWRAGADLRRQEHRRQEFNRMTLSLHTGPRWILTRQSEFSLLASRRQQWAGNQPGYVENGLRLESAQRLGTHWVAMRKGELARSTLRRFETPRRPALGRLPHCTLAVHPSPLPERHPRLWRRTHRTALASFHATPY